MKRLTLRIIVLVSAIVALCTCRGCGKEDGPEAILDLAAPDTLAAVVVPDLGGLAKGVDDFVTRATRNAGAEAVKRLRKSLTTQVGFDPLDVGKYEERGLAAHGPCLLFTEGDSPEPLLAFTITNREAFDNTVKDVLKKTDGASRYASEKVHGWDVQTAGRPFGTEVVPAFYWTYIGRFAITARAEGKSALDAALKRLAASDPGGTRATLRSDPLFRTLSRKVSSEGLTVFARGNAAVKLLSTPESVSRGVITSVRINGKGFELDTFVELEIADLDHALAGPAVLGLADRVADDAALVLMTHAAGPEAVRAARSHPGVSSLVDRALAPLGSAIGVDPEKDILPWLKGPLTLSVHLDDLSEMPRRLQQRRSLAAVLEFVHIAVIADVTDPKRFQAMLDRSRVALAKRGVELRQRTVTVGKLEANIVEPVGPGTATPRLGWAMVGDKYVYGAGAGRLDAILKVLAAGDSGLSTSIEGTVAGELATQPGNSVVLLRVGQLAEAAARITLGQPKAGIGIGALIGSGLQIMRTIGDVGLAVSAEPGGLRLRIRERLQ
ncbi:MAG: hypothetical protein V3T05_06910 [Myxococcota bacterium]